MCHRRGIYSPTVKAIVLGILGLDLVSREHPQNISGLGGGITFVWANHIASALECNRIASQRVQKGLSGWLTRNMPEVLL